MDGTLLEQLAAFIAKLNEVKALCESLTAAAQAQQTAYASAVAAQNTAGSSLAEVVAYAGQIAEKIGNQPAA